MMEVSILFSEFIFYFEIIFSYEGHFFSLVNLYLNKSVIDVNGFILIEITFFRCCYINNWTRMVSIDERFVTIICLEINCVRALIQFVINFQMEEHLLNIFYQASRNLYGLTGPIHSPIEEDLKEKKCSVGETNAK